MGGLPHLDVDLGGAVVFFWIGASGLVDECGVGGEDDGSFLGLFAVIQRRKPPCL